MAVLGTSVDPNWERNKIQQTGEALSMVLNRLDQRREQKKAEELQEIDRFFKAAQAAPEVATTWGNQIKSKYGAKHPGVSEMVDVLQKRYDMADQVRKQQEAGKNAWMTNWNTLNQGYQQQTAETAALPDQAPQVGAQMPGSGFGPPGIGALPVFGGNEYKEEAQRALKKVDPRYFSRKALEQLPPELQVAAADYLKSGTSFEPPTPMTIFDPYKNLPQEQQALYAGQEGFTSPESYQASRVKLGLEQSPSRKAFEKFSVEEREDRQTYETESREDDQAWRDSDREKRNTQMRSRLSYQDSLSRARESRRFANEKGLIDHRASKNGDGGAAVSWDSLVSDSKQAQKDWDVRLKQAVQGLDGTAKTKAKIQFMQQNGQRPKPLLETQARRMARELNTAVTEGSLSIDEAEDEALDMTSDIMAGDSYPAARAANRQRTMGNQGTQDRGELHTEISNMNPDWTDEQVEDAVNSYLWSQAEGGQ